MIRERRGRGTKRSEKRQREMAKLIVTVQKLNLMKSSILHSDLKVTTLWHIRAYFQFGTKWQLMLTELQVKYGLEQNIILQ